MAFNGQCILCARDLRLDRQMLKKHRMYIHVEKTLYVRILEYYESMHNTTMAYYYSSMHTSSLYNTSYSRVVLCILTHLCM